MAPQSRSKKKRSASKRTVPRPSSASHINYGGSRQKKTRFRYKNPNTKSAFVELHPDYVPTVELLYDWLKDCDLVGCLEWQTSKTSQGNRGNHASEHNIKVFPQQHSAGSATEQFIEFEVWRCEPSGVKHVL